MSFMANRICVGCNTPLTSDTISREHILPRWLAEEVREPNLSLKHYRHDEDLATDELLRSHDLGSFAVKNVCIRCNNGWMSRLESRAQPILLGLMKMQTSLLQLSVDQRASISAWAIKTAFMIASVQPGITDLPWHLFRGVAQEPERIPTECFVVGAQLQFLPKGFLYACPIDALSASTDLFQARIGFTIHQLHFAVVIPLVEAPRMVRTSGVHIPLWPLNLEILVRYENFPTLTSPNDLINFVTGLVRA